MNSKLNKNEKIEIIQILISTTSLIISFFYSINHLPWIAIILCGIPIIKDCIQKLITELNIKTDLLVSIAIITSILIGETFAAGEIATIMAIGSFLENYTISKTQRKIKKLAKTYCKI